MAITQGSTPVIKITAAGVVDDTVVPAGITEVNYLHWVSKGAVADDDLLVSDGDGNTLWEEVADGARFSKLHVIKHPIKDLTVTTIDSGTLYVIKQNPTGWNT